MKNIIIILFLIPILTFSQSDTTFNSKDQILIINQAGINDLVRKYKTSLTKKKGVDGWRLQIKFTSKREDILPYQKSFTNFYHHIPSQITFDSPYYKLTVGNFRTKNEALKVKYEINKNFPGAYPISIIIDPDLLKN
jgi:hypothetical protein